MMNNNPFSTTFGKPPLSSILRLEEREKIINDFSALNPTNLVYLITGVRGSGKTVLMTDIASYFSSMDDWIVVDPGPKDNILENIASELFEASKIRNIGTKKELSFSFHGLSFSIEGEKPVPTSFSLIKHLLDLIKLKGKKVLITIDEVDNSEQMKYFSQAYQSLIRSNYQVMLLMTGLYDNFAKLQEDKSLTFLYRVPKIYLNPLNTASISRSYSHLLSIDIKEASHLAKLTNGYAYAYQLLGSLLFFRESKEIDFQLLNDFDLYLSEYVYDKVYSELTTKEIDLVKCFETNDEIKVSNILKKSTLDEKSFSVYRDRLIKKGIIYSPRFGYLKFLLPRFFEYLYLK